MSTPPNLQKTVLQFDPEQSITEFVIFTEKNSNASTIFTKDKCDVYLTIIDRDRFRQVISLDIL
jgi:hypothetical protein